MGRTPADKGGTVFSVADRNSAARKFALLLLKDDELNRTVIDARYRYARAIKALDKRLQGKASLGLLHHSVEAQNPSIFGWSMTPLDRERLDRSWRLGIKYESEISDALEALGVRAAWLPRFLLIPPRAGFGGPAGPFLKPAQVLAEKRDVSDFVRLVLESSLPELNSLLDQPPAAGIVSLEITYDPSEESRKSFEHRVLDQIRPQLDDIEEQYRTRHGLSKRPRKRPELAKHVEWLYQRLVESKSWPEIAGEARPEVDSSTVQDATRNLAEALGIDLPAGKPGRPPKRRAERKS